MMISTALSNQLKMMNLMRQQGLVKCGFKTQFTLKFLTTDVHDVIVVIVTSFVISNVN